MFRVWIVGGLVLLVLIWNLFIKAMIVLVIALVIGGGIWGYWEIRHIRKATRKPPGA